MIPPSHCRNVISQKDKVSFEASVGETYTVTSTLVTEQEPEILTSSQLYRVVRNSNQEVCVLI